ncbi:hypothetical protein H8959_020994, partial [Pygathrix nigripes]
RSDTFTVQDSTAMSWWRNNFWIILAVAIIVVSVGLGLILYCVCKRQLRQGKKWEIAKPLKNKQADEEKMYENVLNESPVQLPPLPPRNWPSLEDSLLWEQAEEIEPRHFKAFIQICCHKHLIKSRGTPSFSFWHSRVQRNKIAIQKEAILSEYQKEKCEV